MTGGDTIEDFNITRPFSQHSTVHIAIKTIANAIAQLGSEVWPLGADRRADEAIENHWLPPLLKSPSESMDGETLMYATLVFLESYGEAFWWKQEPHRDLLDGPKFPHDIMLLFPQSMWPGDRDPATNVIRSWMWNGPRGTREIKAEDLVFFRYFNPYDPERGLSSVKALTLEYGADHSAAVWNKKHFDNMAMPGIVFESPEEPWPTEERQEFLEAWDMKIRGAHRTGLSAALPQGVKATLVQSAHVDMQFLEGRKLTRENVLSGLGVPPAEAGIYTVSPYATSHEQSKKFWHNTLIPKINTIQGAINRQLLWPTDRGVGLFLSFESVLAEIAAKDMKDKIESGAKLWAMGWPAADINDSLNLGLPTAGRPWLRVGYLPFSVVPASSLLVEPGDDEPEFADDEGEDGEPGGTARLEEIARNIELKGDPRAAQWAGQAALYADIGRAYGLRLKSWLYGIRRETLGNLARLDDETRRIMGHLRSDGDPLIKAFEDDVLWQDEQALVKLVGISKVAWMQAVQRGVSAVERETGAAIDFNFTDPRVVLLFQRRESLIKNVSKRVRDRVRDTLSDGVREGESVRKLSARVRDVFDADRRRSLTIARTEVAQTFNGGRFEAKMQAGIKFHEWLTSRDTRVRDSHMDLDTDVVEVGEPFRNGLLYAGDPGGYPGETINCRCTNPARRSRED
jgi:SPP1 gp7 family putative phage head morphogenesis protein